MAELEGSEQRSVRVWMETVSKIANSEKEEGEVLTDHKADVDVVSLSS